jgi:hypothetical protein
MNLAQVLHEPANLLPQPGLARRFAGWEMLARRIQGEAQGKLITDLTIDTV